MYFKCPPFGSPSQPKDELWEDKNIAGKLQRQTRRTQSSCANPSCWFTECSLFTNFRRLVLTYSKGPAQEMRKNDLPATTCFEQAQYYDMLWLCRGNLWARKVLRRKQKWRRGKTEKRRKEKMKSCLLRRQFEDFSHKNRVSDLVASIARIVMSQLCVAVKDRFQ